MNICEGRQEYQEDQEGNVRHNILTHGITQGIKEMQLGGRKMKESNQKSMHQKTHTHTHTLREKEEED